MFAMRLGNERGIALVVVLLISVVVAAISVGAVLVSSNTQLVINYGERETILQAVADAGLEKGRSTVNGNKSLYPSQGYNTLEDGVSVQDAAGTTIPGVKRWLYVGPTGITSGQYGVFGSVVSVAQDQAGSQVVRRLEIVQESFAKFAYFTTLEGSIIFGGGDVLWGPVHSNDRITIQASTPIPRATFYGTVTTGQTIQNKSYAQFAQGYTENGGTIPMPATADLTKLKIQADAGSTSFVSTTNGLNDEATTRIEFVAIDLNADGFRNGPNEGFIKVYQSGDPKWVVGARPADYNTNALRNSRNCGHTGDATTWHNGTFESADEHGTAGAETGIVGSGNWQNIIVSGQRGCFLGGADEIFGGFTPTDNETGTAGGWVQWTGPVDPLVTNARAAIGDAQYLIPITRAFNPNFKGVIYVQGKVAVSGVVRGRITLAATDNIVIADDIQYATNPSAGTCEDMLGLFSAEDVVVADNTLNAPTRPTNAGSGNYLTFDDTRDETIHAVILALNIFTVQNYNSGSSTFEPCGGTAWGRGCLALTGGIIQKQRGAVGTTGGTGYLKRYSYDQCGFSEPPPYFPTTGRFSRGRYYEVNPVGFSVSTLYDMLTPS